MAAETDTTSIPEPVGDTLACVGCGYDLRELSEDGVCPECGTPIARSRAGEGDSLQWILDGRT